MDDIIHFANRSIEGSVWVLDRLELCEGEGVEFGFSFAGSDLSSKGGELLVGLVNLQLDLLEDLRKRLVWDAGCHCEARCFGEWVEDVNVRCTRVG